MTVWLQYAACFILQVVSLTAQVEELQQQLNAAAAAAQVQAMEAAEAKAALETQLVELKAAQVQQY